MDYPTLRDRVQKYTVRSDTTFSSMCETFAMLACERIFNGHGKRGDPMYSPPLRVKEMEQTETLTTDATGSVAVPDGFLSARALYVVDQFEPLMLVSADDLAAVDAAGVTGNANRYAVIDGAIKVAPIQAATLKLTYFKRPADASIANPSNSVMTAYPAVFFSAMLFEAWKFIREPEDAMAALAATKSAIDGANRVAFNARVMSGMTNSQFEPIG